jgi:restriction system protein
MNVVAGLDNRPDLLAMAPYKGMLVPTSLVTRDGHAFAARHGRIEIMECEHVKYLCKEHLGLDVLISLPKPPPR